MSSAKPTQPHVVTQPAKGHTTSQSDTTCALRTKLNKMKLSIITINYNNAEGLCKTLASVASQTYADIEHIIVDGGSTDGSVEIIEAYALDVARTASSCVPTGGEGSCAAVEGQDATSPKATKPHKVTWISEPDKGIYNAMNKGIEIALGRRIVNSFNRSELVEDKSKENSIASQEYIQILNSGDLLAAPDVTEKMVHQLSQYGESVGILYGNMIKEYPNGKRVKDTCLGDSKTNGGEIVIRETEWTMYDFIKGTINHDPTYIHRSLYEKYGLYDDSLKIVSDWKWFVQTVVFGGEKVFYIPMDVTIFDMTGISETNLAAREIERCNEMEKMFPVAVLKDYDAYHFPINQIQRLKRHHMWPLVYFVERVLFKLEKWGILK